MIKSLISLPLIVQMFEHGRIVELPKQGPSQRSIAVDTGRNTSSSQCTTFFKEPKNCGTEKS